MAKEYRASWVSGRWYKKFPNEKSPRAVSPRQLRKLFPDLIKGKGTTKDETYLAANAWVEAKITELADQKQKPVPTLVRTPSGAIMPIADVAVIQGAIQRAGFDWSQLDALDELQLFETFAKRRTKIVQPEPIDGNTSVAHQITVYKKKQQKFADAGEIAAGRYQKIANSLNWIGTFCESANHPQIAAFAEADTLENFYIWLKAQVKEKKLSIYTVRDHFQVIRVFIQWLAERRLITLPLNITSKKFRFKLPKLKYRYWTKEEFESAYANATERVKLYLLLIANCGFYGSDIGTMKKSGLDLKKGTLKHQRKKTGEDLEDGFEASSNVPEVTYKLWPETLALLKKHLSDHANLCLLNEDGGVLWEEGVHPDGRYWKNDNVASAYKRLKEKLDNPNTLENIRKTSAQFLSDSTHFRCADMFGGWAEKTTRTKHYTEVSQSDFFAACDFLREQYLGP